MLETVRTSRVCYLTGSIGFVVIGFLHTVTHALELAGTSLQQRFNGLGSIQVTGRDVASWDLFQGTSLLMGFFSMAIGFGAVGALRAVASDGLPPLGTAATNIAALLGVMAVGVAHLGPIQIWGGLFGVAMFAPTVLASLSLPRSESGE